MEQYLQNIWTLYPKTFKLLALLGLFIAAKKGLSIIHFLFKLLRPSRDLSARYGPRSWAVVTGSTDGIGKAICFQLAGKGFNIVQVSRSKDKLEKVAKQLQTQTGCQTHEIVCDFSRDSNTQTFYDRIVSEVGDRDVSMLVNNVGVDVLGQYCSLPVKDIQKIIDVNIYPVSMLCHKLIPRMLKRKQRSAIVIVSSLAGQFPIALHNIYSASKTFTDYLARTLSYEYPQIDFLSLRPSEVQTPMTFNKSDLFTITARQCAQGMCNVLGREVYSEGHWNHQLQGVIYRAVPQSIFNYIFMNMIAPEFISKRK